MYQFFAKALLPRRVVSMSDMNLAVTCPGTSNRFNADSIIFLSVLSPIKIKYPPEKCFGFLADVKNLTIAIRHR